MNILLLEGLQEKFKKRLNQFWQLESMTFIYSLIQQILVSASHILDIVLP